MPWLTALVVLNKNDIYVLGAASFFSSEAPTSVVSDGFSSGFATSWSATQLNVNISSPKLKLIVKELTNPSLLFFKTLQQ